MYLVFLRVRITSDHRDKMIPLPKDSVTPHLKRFALDLQVLLSEPTNVGTRDLVI